MNRALLTFGLGFALALSLGWMALPKVLYSSTEQPLQFSHKTHAGEKVGMACEDCHALSEDGRFGGFPTTEQCSGCHSEPQGKTADEKRLVDDYVAKGREIPWLSYARQPENVYFSHAPHVKLGGIRCEQCHPGHGTSDRLRPLERNRISSYSRDVEGESMIRLTGGSHGMKMTSCSECHHQRGVRESCLTCHK